MSESAVVETPATPIDWKDTNTRAVLGTIIDNMTWRHEGEANRLHLVLDNLDKDQQQLFAELAQQSPTSGGADPILVALLAQNEELRAMINDLAAQVQGGTTVETAAAPVQETAAEKVARLQAELAAAESEASSGGSQSPLAGA